MGHNETQHALDTLAKWGKNPSTDGGENIGFSVSRQGAPSDAFMGMGDCTPFAASGARGTLSGQPVGRTGAPVAYFDDFGGALPTVDRVPFTFAFDLDAGKVSLAGAFPGLSPTLSFSVEYVGTFDAAGGKNILFHSKDTSDKAAYILAVQLVGAS